MSNQNRTFGGDTALDYAESAVSFALKCPYDDSFPLRMLVEISQFKRQAETLLQMIKDQRGEQ